MYKFHMDDKFIEVTDFSESLDGAGNLTFQVSTHDLDLKKSTFAGLRDLKAAIADKEIVLKITDEKDNVLWEDADYDLQNASFSASSTGVYFSAYFSQFAPTPVDGMMEVPDVEE